MFLGHFGLAGDERKVEWTGLAMWLFVPWGWWIDRHRTIVPAG